MYGMNILNSIYKLKNCYQDSLVGLSEQPTNNNNNKMSIELKLFYLMCL